MVQDLPIRWRASICRYRFPRQDPERGLLETEGYVVESPHLARGLRTRYQFTHAAVTAIGLADLCEFDDRHLPLIIQVVPMWKG